MISSQMQSENTLKDLELLIRSRYGLILLDTIEEERAETLLAHLADSLTLPVFFWTRTKGLRRSGEKTAVYGSTSASGALEHIENSDLPALYVFHGLWDYMSDKITGAKLMDASSGFSSKRGAILLTGTPAELPENLRPMSAVYRLPRPGMAEYRALLSRIIRDLSRKIDLRVAISDADTNRLLTNIKGLTMMEAEKILTRVMVEDSQLTPDDVRSVSLAKKELVEKEGLLEYYPAENSMADIADLAGLKAWLAKRKEMSMNPDGARDFGLSFPRGILLTGVQGCGKSLCAKAVAMEWGFPLLKLDPSNLYNKYIGESERNFRRAIKTAEQMAPVVLWIDEIEKAFASSASGSDDGVSLRIFGTFLSWLQDRKAEVFVVATANDISRLPPEFIRKGRFDEIFFVDLPTPEARKAIFVIHLKKRGREPGNFDLPALVRISDGFNGAEIEQAVVAGLYTAFSSKKKLSTELLTAEIHATNPLSRTMAEKIAELREWSKGRTVSAQ
ncbi:MAG: AAA family ATPase [bacterium]